MDASKAEQLKAHTRAIAELLYEETAANNPEFLETFEGIELALRDHILEHVGSELGEFFVKQQAAVVPEAAAGSTASLATSKSRKNKLRG